MGFTVKGAEDGLLSKGFYQRQELYEQRRREKKERQMSEFGHEGRCTFHPEINFTSEILVEADPKRSSETNTQRIQLLTQRDPKKQEMLKEIYNVEVKAKYTYHPQINERSKVLQRTASVDELALAERAKSNKAKLLEEAQQKQREECTFHPQINATHKIPSAYELDDKIMERIREREKSKEARRQQQARDAEYEEIKLCTFQPTIKHIDAMPEPAVVRGSDPWFQRLC